MKSIILFVLLFLFFGCADKSAFSKFDLQPIQERAVDNMEFSKIVQDNQIYGIAIGLDLTTLQPKKFSNREVFYVVISPKNRKIVQNITFEIMKTPPLKIFKLSPSNEYSNLIQIQSRWSHYYEVVFPKNLGSKSLTIRLQNGATATLNFQKNE